MNKKSSKVTQAADLMGAYAPTQPFCQKDDEKLPFISAFPEATNKNKSTRHFVEISGLKIEI